MTHHTRRLLCLAAFSALLWFNPHPASARFCGNDPINNVDPLGLEEKNPDDFMEKMLSGVETRHVSGSTVDPEEVKEAAEVTMEIGRSVPESIITTMLMGAMGRGVKIVERPLVNSGAGQAIGSFLTRISRSARITGRRVVRFFSREKTVLAEEGVSLARGGRTSANLARATKEVAREAERSAAKKPMWGSWNDYRKVSQGGQEYAQVGDRLYTRHAVDRMQPSGLGAPGGADSAGRSIAPTFVDDVIQNGTTITRTVDGVERTIHTSGSVQVVTEQGGKIVVTINPFSGRN